MTLASFWSWAGRFDSYQVENLEDKFSHDEAQINMHLQKASLQQSTQLYSILFCFCLTDTQYEPTHEFMALIAIRKLILQTRMRSNPLGLKSDFWPDPSSTSIRYVCEQQRRWRDCAPEPSLFAYAISTIIPWAGSYGYGRPRKSGTLSWWGTPGQCYFVTKISSKIKKYFRLWILMSIYERNDACCFTIL